MEIETYNCIYDLITEVTNIKFSIHKRNGIKVQAIYLLVKDSPIIFLPFYSKDEFNIYLNDIKFLENLTNLTASNYNK